MKRGFIISGALLIFVFALIIVSFSFVLSHNELHNAAMTSFIVEKARWIADADDYYCMKDVRDGRDPRSESYNSNYGVGNYSAVFNDSYDRPEYPGNKSILYPSPDEPRGAYFLDFFEQPFGFIVNYTHNNPPRVGIYYPSPGDSVSRVDNLVYDLCDSDVSLFDSSTRDTFNCSLYYNVSLSCDPESGDWEVMRAGNGDPIENVDCVKPPHSPYILEVNFSSAGSGKKCFLLNVSDSYGAFDVAVVENISVT